LHENVWKFKNFDFSYSLPAQSHKYCAAKKMLLPLELQCANADNKRLGSKADFKGKYK